ncbi:MAG: response regulator [Planctomycetes bacterium]|jgi:DNA-binding response OmpR family regulator|nr:response regulator transcription factor [Phycisphaerae bacterium]NBB94593.1 response regulator [Planctomycetota bacterium]
MSDDLSAKTILVVDDDPDILQSVESALEELGARVVCARDGKEAVRQAEAATPDLVVLDQMMPGHNGLVVLEHLRQGKGEDDPPHVIMVTANDGTRHEMYAATLGARAYLRKPFKMSKLVEVARGILTG